MAPLIMRARSSKKGFWVCMARDSVKDYSWKVRCRSLPFQPASPYNAAGPRQAGERGCMILVAGGAGFIGSNLVAALDQRGERVAVADWLGAGDKWRNLAKREIEAFVRPEALDAWLEERGGELDLVYHLGAISSTTETDADRLLENNVLLSQRLWSWCAENGEPLIYASSAATYG